MMNILRKTLILPILVLISGCGTKEQELSSKVYIISEDGTNLLAASETGVRGRGNARGITGTELQ